MFCLDFGSEFPEERAKLSGYRDFDFVMMELAFSKGVEPVAESGLGGPGELFYPSRSVFLTFGELGTDFRRNAVVSGLLNEDPSCVRVAAFADAALSFASPTGVLRRDQPEERHEFLWVFESAEGSNLADRHHGGDQLKAFECHHGFHKRFALPVLQELKHRLFESVNALLMKFDGADVVFEHPVVGGIGKGEMAKVALVGLGPMSLSVVVVSEAPKEGKEARFGATEIINCIGAGTAKVADGFVGGVGNVYRDQVVCPEAFGQFHRIPFIGFDSVSRASRYE